MAIKTTKTYQFDSESLIQGMVEVKIPLYPERLRLLSKMRFKPSEDGQLIHDDSNGLERIAISLELLKDYVVKVDCEIVETKEKIETLDELMILSECQDVLVKAATDLVQGISLGKKLPTS